MAGQLEEFVPRLPQELLLVDQRAEQRLRVLQPTLRAQRRYGARRVGATTTH